jgi:hypothetical protein
MRDTLQCLIILLVIPWVAVGMIERSKTLNQNAAMLITIATDAPPAAIDTLVDWMNSI